MTNVDNTLLRQMQKLAASLTAMQSAAGKDKGSQAAVSFQDMMQKSTNKTSSETPSASEQDAASEKPSVDGKQEDEALEEGKLPVQTDKEQEELKPENLAANPNAVAMLDLLRPEIVETVEEQPADAVVTAIPEEAVQETAMNLDDQMPQMETGVETGVGAEVPMDQQPKEFHQEMEQAPAQDTAPQQTQSVQPRQQEAAPEQQEAVEQVDKTDLSGRVEVKTDSQDNGEETHGEAVVQEQPVFHEAEAVPVKVGERYETVDTQKPEMEAKLADTIQNAVQAGSEKVEIHLAPQNLGSLVIEMTKDTSGALQVVLHASNAKAAGVLNQHLDGLHTALQGYGHEEVRVEVQRNEESQQQNFRHADPDGKGQQQHRQQQERHEEEHAGGEDFMQKLRLGLFGTEDLL